LKSKTHTKLNLNKNLCKRSAVLRSTQPAVLVCRASCIHRFLEHAKNWHISHSVIICVFQAPSPPRTPQRVRVPPVGATSTPRRTPAVSRVDGAAAASSAPLVPPGQRPPPSSSAKPSATSAAAGATPAKQRPAVRLARYVGWRPLLPSAATWLVLMLTSRPVA
jgi:hypothetical protein